MHAQRALAFAKGERVGRVHRTVRHILSAPRGPTRKFKAYQIEQENKQWKCGSQTASEVHNKESASAQNDESNESHTYRDRARDVLGHGRARRGPPSPTRG